jgi:cation diffusion facilitator family transporter
MNESNTYYKQALQNKAVIKRVSLITLSANIVLTALKLVFGAVFLNISVLSDAAHSASDVITTVIVLIAIAVAKPETDKQHNYGHEKIEQLLVLAFSVILIGTAGFLVFKGITGIISPEKTSLNYYLLSETALSIVSKEAMYWYTMRHAKKTGSGALKADAWHHRSDSLSSIAVLIGLVTGIFTKTNLVESIAVILVALLIAKVGVQIAIPSINQLIDKALDEKTCEKLKAIILQTDGVEGMDSLQTRLFGGGVYVDVEIRVNGALSVSDSHKIAQAVHDKLERQNNCFVKHCNVHVNPN